MTHVIAVLAFALLCAVWVVVQVAAGREPRACKGDGKCELDANGEKTCRRECPTPRAPTDVVVARDVVRPRRR